MNEEQNIEKETLRVWDLPTRVFHWSLVVLALLAWITSEAEGVLFWTHLAAGYGVMGLVAFRLIWGVIGTRHARFTDFVRPWPVVRDHTLEMVRFSLSRSMGRSVGHTPAGGWMILALLAALALLVASGLFAGDEGEKGPLADLAGAGLADGLGEVHEGLNTILWGLVFIHVAAVLLVSYFTRDNLIRAMWTGRKENPARFIETGDEENVPEDISPAGFPRAAISVAAAVAAVLAVIR